MRSWSTGVWIVLKGASRSCGHKTLQHTSSAVVPTDLAVFPPELHGVLDPEHQRRGARATPVAPEGKLLAPAHEQPGETVREAVVGVRFGEEPQQLGPGYVSDDGDVGVGGLQGRVPGEG